MHIRFLMFVLLSALICACNGSGDNAKAPSAPSHAESSPVPQGHTGAAVPAPAEAEALPPDGGDVGAAYQELIAALRALDSDRANRLFEHHDEQPVALDKNDVDEILRQTQTLRVASGLRREDRATLFLTGEKSHGALGASRVSGSWVFDDIAPITWDDAPAGAADCGTASYFPCGVKTYPDALVSGREQVDKFAPKNNMAPSSGVLLDGYGARILDAQTKALVYTQVVLTPVAFAPHELSARSEADAMPGWRFGSIALRVAPDNKSAKLFFLNGLSIDNEHPETDATPGLQLDASTPHRLRGRLDLAAKDIAKFDVTFDVDTTSQCLAGRPRCGNP